MKKYLLIFLFGLAPIFAVSFPQLVEAAEMWWCSECGLAYPASQKVCLNDKCSLCRKKR